MQNIIVFYGGKSSEHDISILTAIQTMKNMNKDKYKVYPVYITQDNNFIIPKNYLDVKTYTKTIKNFKEVNFVFGKGEIKIKKHNKVKVDCAINCCHGLNGEDGTLNALATLCEFPITSCSMLSGAVCMDKIIMKDVFKANNIPCVDYTYISMKDFDNDSDLCVKEIESKLCYPMIVKPSNLGSSIGITKVNSKQELELAIGVAGEFDDRIIIEKCLENFKEINISCVGNYECEVSALEQPLSWTDFLKFDDKYTKKDVINKKIVNPKLNKNIEKEIKYLAQKMFKVFNLSGVIRIDFMVCDGSVFVNEINTIPGSMAYYLWKEKNVEFFELIDKIIYIAKQKFDEINMHNYKFNSTVLSNYKENSINKYAK